MGHINHSSIEHGDYNSMRYRNQTTIGYILHLNQSNIENKGHMNHSDMGHMNSSVIQQVGHINRLECMGHVYSDIEHTGHMNQSDMESMGHKHMHAMDHKPFFSTKTSAAMFFHQWPTDTQVGIATALIASFIIAITLECLQEYSRIVFLRFSSRKTGSGRFGTHLYGCHEKLFMSVLMIIRVMTGYLLMLSVMTMNIWIMICVCLGATIGYGLGKPLVALVVFKQKPLPEKQKEVESILLKNTKGEVLRSSPETRYKSNKKTRSETGFNEESVSMVQEK